MKIEIIKSLGLILLSQIFILPALKHKQLFQAIQPHLSNTGNETAHDAEAKRGLQTNTFNASQTQY